MAADASVEKRSEIPPPRAKGGHGCLWALLILLVLGVGAVAAGWALGKPWWTPVVALFLRPKPPAPRVPPKVPVVVATVRQGDLPIYFSGLGTVAAYNTVAVRARVDGQLMKIAFREGDLVKEGQLLAEIDPRPFEVQRAQAQGQYAKDSATLENARVDLRRLQEAGEAVSRQQLDAAKALVDQLVGTLQTDQAAIDNANLQLAYCRITAPLTGQVGLRQVDQGNMVRATDANPLLVITQLQPIAVIFTLPQDNLHRVLQAQSATGATALKVEAYARDLRTLLATGTLLAIDNQIDTTTGTVRCKAEFKNEDRRLYPNQFVNARLLVDVRRDVVLVPNAALQRSPQMSFVYLVGPENKVQVREVTPGQSEAGSTIVRSGLEAGDVVVTDGVDKLREGMVVVPRQPGQRSATQPATGPATRGAAKREGRPETRRGKP